MRVRDSARGNHPDAAGVGPFLTDFRIARQDYRTPGDRRRTASNGQRQGAEACSTCDRRRTRCCRVEYLAGTVVNASTQNSQQLVDLLALDESGENVWRSRSLDPRGGRMFGGTMIALALSAARRSVPSPMSASSLSVNLLRPADGGAPCDYHVGHLQDGSSSVTRSVAVVQLGETVAVATIVFRMPRDAWAHGDRAHPFPDPNLLPNTGMPHPARAVPPGAFDIGITMSARTEFKRRLWFRATGAPSEHVELDVPQETCIRGAHTSIARNGLSLYRHLHPFRLDVCAWLHTHTQGARKQKDRLAWHTFLCNDWAQLISIIVSVAAGLQSAPKQALDQFTVIEWSRPLPSPAPARAISI